MTQLQGIAEPHMEIYMLLGAACWSSLGLWEGGVREKRVKQRETSANDQKDAVNDHILLLGV